MRECFQRADDALRANKDNVLRLADALEKEREIIGNAIYQRAGLRPPKFFWQETAFIKQHSDDQPVFDILATPAVIQAQSVVRGFLVRQRDKKKKAEYDAYMTALKATRWPRPYRTKSF